MLVCDVHGEQKYLAPEIVFPTSGPNAAECPQCAAQQREQLGLPEPWNLHEPERFLSGFDPEENRR